MPGNYINNKSFDKNESRCWLNHSKTRGTSITELCNRRIRSKVLALVHSRLLKNGNLDNSARSINIKENNFTALQSLLKVYCIHTFNKNINGRFQHFHREQVSVNSLASQIIHRSQTCSKTEPSTNRTDKFNFQPKNRHNSIDTQRLTSTSKTQQIKSLAHTHTYLYTFTHIPKRTANRPRNVKRHTVHKSTKTTVHKGTRIYIYVLTPHG